MGPGDAGEMETCASGSLRTRSHSRADPLWTVQDMLILVNEIAVVEGDCQNALSSYQKWSMIAENCTALEVVRNSNQCRRKWVSLLAEYKLVKQYESKSGEASYWSLGFEKRKEKRLPVDFDQEVYEAIDNVTKLQDQADTDPEDDPEAAEIDVQNAEESGSKPKRVNRKSTLPKKITEERIQPVVEEEEPMKQVPFVEVIEQIPAGCKHKRARHRVTPHKVNNEVNKQPKSEKDLVESLPVEVMEQIPTVCKNKSTRPPRLTPHKGKTEVKKQPETEKELQESVPVEEMEEIPKDCNPEKPRHRLSSREERIEEDKHDPLEEEMVQEPNRVYSKRKKQSPLKEELKKPDSNDKQMEQILEKRLKGNTELINAILAENQAETEDGMADKKDEDDAVKTEKVRCQAEKLISCLIDLSKNLQQLCDVIEE